MSAAPYFDSGGFNRDQANNIGVVLHDLDGAPYVASGGTGGGGGIVQLQVRDVGSGTWVNLEGTAARGVEVDPITGAADAAIGLPSRVDVVGGYDGTNVRALKTSAAGVVQVDVLSNPAGGATSANQATEITRLTEIRDRLPDVTIATAPAATDEGMIVHVASMPGGGGGVNTEYTEGATDSTITGIAAMWEDTGDTLRAVSAAKPLPVAQQGAVALDSTTLAALETISVANFPGTQPVSGSVTADTELTTGDLDTGAGTDTRAVMGLVRAESGGGLLVGSANPLPITISTLPAGNNNIGDVDLASAIPVGDNIIGRVKITDGTDMAEVVTASGASTPPVAGTAGLTVHVASMPASGGGGGGVQYTEGDVDATVTGTAVMWSDTSDNMLVASDTSPLPVKTFGSTVTVQDGGGSITVDGTVGVTGAVDTELTVADLDTGAGTDTRGVVGLVRAESGGGLLVGSANPMPVSGTITANAGTGPFPVSDNAGSLTVDNPILSVVGGGTEAAAQRVTIATDSTGVLSVDDNGSSLTVDGTVAISGAVDTELPAAATLADNMANPTVPGVGAFSMVWDGANWDREPSTRTVSGTVTANAGTGPFPVSDNAGSLTVDAPVGTPVFTRLSDGAAALIGQKTMANSLPVTLASDQSVVAVAGAVAHDAADSGNPQKIGARALSADITAVAANDRVDALTTLLGKLLIQPYALPASSTQGNVNLTTTTAADVIAAPGAGIRLYITEVTITNAHATVGTKVEIRDGTTVRKIVHATSDGGGASIKLPTPLRLTANTALTARCVTTGADVDVSATGYTAAE